MEAAAGGKQQEAMRVVRLLTLGVGVMLCYVMYVMLCIVVSRHFPRGDNIRHRDFYPSCFCKEIRVRAMGATRSSPMSASLRLSPGAQERALASKQ